MPMLVPSSQNGYESSRIKRPHVAKGISMGAKPHSEAIFTLYTIFMLNSVYLVITVRNEHGQTV